MEYKQKTPRKPRKAFVPAERFEGDAPSAGNEPEVTQVQEHPIDVIAEYTPRMTQEEMQKLYLKRSQDANQLMIARLQLVTRYKEDRRLEGIYSIDLENHITNHLTPVEIVQFDHEVMWKGSKPGVDTLVERMSKAGAFTPTTLADFAPNRLGITDMATQGLGVSKIAKALRIGEDAAMGLALGVPGDTTLDDLDYILHSGDGSAPDDLDVPEMPTPGSTGHWFSGGTLHIVRRDMKLYGRDLTVVFIINSDYDQYDTDMIVDTVDKDLLPRMFPSHPFHIKEDVIYRGGEPVGKVNRKPSVWYPLASFASGFALALALFMLFPA